jgi:hypothetical protein
MPTGQEDREDMSPPIRFPRGCLAGSTGSTPVTPPFPSPIAGSRFSCLVDEDAGDDLGLALAEEVAWDGFEDEPFVPPVICRPDIPLEEVAEDFWRKIGYPTPES